MVRTAGARLGLVLLAGSACTSSSRPIGILDAETGARVLVVETWNAGLGERTEPSLSLRRPRVVEAIAASPADVLCLQGVFRASDKNAIVEAAKARFPHAASFATDLDTRVDDPTDASGKVPPAPTEPPCSGSEVRAAMDAAHQCLVEKCSTVPGDDAGYLTTHRCLRYNCLSLLYAVLDKSPRCFACARMTSQDATLRDTRNRCTNDVRAGLAFDGQNDLLLLSRAPIVEARLRTLPSTDQRRAVLSAKIGALDVYCTSFSAPATAVDLPYTGAYGGGAVGVNGWIAENLLQAQKLVAWIAGTARGPAIVLGDFRTGPGHEEGGRTLVTPAPAFRTWELLAASFVQGVAPSYAPACTRCPDNGLTFETPPYWFAHVFGRDLPKGFATSTVRTQTESIGDLEGRQIARSFDYGLRSTITVP